MTRRVLVSLILLALIAGAVAVGAARDDDGPVPLRSAPAAGSRTDAPPARRTSARAAVGAPAIEEPPTEPAAAEAAPASDVVDWEVLCVGPGGAPIPGVTLSRRDENQVCAETDAHGRAVLRVLAGSAPVSIYFGGTVDSEFRDVSGPTATVRFDDALPLDVTVIDASTGAAVTGVAVTLHRAFGAANWPLAADGGVHRLVASPAKRGAYFDEMFDTTLPAGLASPGRHFAWTSRPVSGAATSAKLALPVWPSGTVRLRVVDAAGSPVRGEVEVEPYVARMDVWKRKLTTDADGRVAIDGLPVIPFASLSLAVESNGRKVSSAPQEFSAAARVYDVAVTLPESPTEDWGGGCGGGSGICVRHTMKPSAADTALSVLALRRDGTPARRSRVIVSGLTATPDPDGNPARYSISSWEYVARTDDAGRLRVRGIPLNSWRDESATSVTVELLETGITPVEQKVELRSGDHRDVELREPDGESIELTVVDDQGRPVEWAQVTALQDRTYQDWNWAALDGDVQDLSPHTDAAGRFVFRNLPPGEITVQCVYGRSRVSGKFPSGGPARLVVTR